MFKKIAAAAALALVASSSFAAAPTAFYGGVDVGVTKLDTDGYDLGNLGDSKTSFGGFVGYGFNQFFAVELGYRQLGKWDLYGSDFNVKQTHLSVVGSYPLAPQLDLYGRLGYNHLSGEASARGYTVSTDDDGALYGIGLNYNFTPTISGRIEAQKPSSDSTNYSVGVVFKF